MTDRTEPTLPLRVAELLCSRLCHDLISPVAAVSNGLELLGDDDGGMDGEITSLLTFSVGQAAGWLMFYRVAYGLGGDNADALALSDAAALIRGIVEEDKIVLDLAAGAAPLGKDATKLMLNTALVGLETLPNRGKFTLAVEKGDGIRIEIVTEGEGTALRPEVRGVLAPDIDVSGLTARTVQGHFTAWLAHSLGGVFVVEAEEPGRVRLAATIPAAA